MDRSPLLRIRDYHPLWCGFPANFCSLGGCSPPHLPHIAVRNSARSGRPSVTLLTGSHWFLFHPVLRYFNSRGCYTPQLPEAYAARFQDQRLRAPTLDLSQLTAGLCGHQPSHPLHGLQHIYTSNTLAMEPRYVLSFHTHDLPDVPMYGAEGKGWSLHVRKTRVDEVLCAGVVGAVRALPSEKEKAIPDGSMYETEGMLMLLSTRHCRSKRALKKASKKRSINKRASI